MFRHNSVFLCFVLILCQAIVLSVTAQGQESERPGKSIGEVSVQGKLIVVELDEGALGLQNLFDLNGRTLRFIPADGGYRVENTALQWDADFGSKMTQPGTTLRNFTFPFSTKQWESFSVGATGSIRFGPKSPSYEQPWERSREVPDEGGVSVGRFDPLSDAAGNLVNSVPAICVFFKPRMTGERYVKELADRVVVTWDVTEPWGNIQDFTWTKTINRFQTVLHKDGAIDMSYKELAAKDAVVGVYPLVSPGAEKSLATLRNEKRASGAIEPNLDIQNVKLSVLDNLLLKVTFETTGPVLPEGDASSAEVAYRVYFTAHKGSIASSEPAQADAVWTIQRFLPRRPNGTSRYMAFGPGVSRTVKTSGNAISIQGILPPVLRGDRQIDVAAESFGARSNQPAAQIPAYTVAFNGVRNPEKHLSSLTPKDGPYTVIYESFHYYSLPNPRDLSCTVIKSLGDKFDFLAYYSDFRIDNQEAGTPSDGPLGAVGGAVTGIGANQQGLESYCTPGRFQWEFIQPVYVNSNQMQERPPADAPTGTDRDITFYRNPLDEISQGSLPPYMYAMSQIAHEMGHRWAAFVSAKPGDQAISLGPVHWAKGLQAPVAFPYQRPTEASIMGGGVWQDNFDGTYTQLDDDYYVPATGWSYLDLYLMGLISPAEVPDFFILRNLVPAGKDANGHAIFKAERTKITIQDVIAAEGPRSPSVDKSQRQFNTGMVMVVQHGQKPSSKLVEETEAIRKLWINYFSITTGRRASMTADPD